MAERRDLPGLQLHSARVEYSDASNPIQAGFGMVVLGRSGVAATYTPLVNKRRCSSKVVYLGGKSGAECVDQINHR